MRAPEDKLARDELDASPVDERDVTVKGVSDEQHGLRLVVNAKPVRPVQRFTSAGAEPLWRSAKNRRESESELPDGGVADGVWLFPGRVVDLLVVVTARVGDDYLNRAQIGRGALPGCLDGRTMQVLPLASRRRDVDSACALVGRGR